MKTLKTLGLSLAVASLTAGMASAAVTTIRVVGSTAFRAPDTAAIIQYLNANPVGGSSLHAGYDNASSGVLGAGGSILANGTIGSSGTATIVVECYWTGSLAGTVDVASQSATDIFLDPSTLPQADITAFNGSSVTVGTSDNTTLFGGGAKLATLITGGTTSTPPSGTVFAAPDLAFSDSAATSIQNELGTADLYTGPVGNTTSLPQLVSEIAGTSATIKDAGTIAKATKHTTVGIVPFQWAIGNITASSTTKGFTSISNITQQTAETLITAGYVPQSFLTGGNGTPDSTNYFYLVGRNEDSGTRIAALSESQFGVTNNPVQFQLTGTSGTLSSVIEWPGSSALNTEPNIAWSFAGHSGYPTGGGVASALNLAESGSPTAPTLFTDSSNAPGNSAAAFFIGYLGITDAATVTGTLLSYNGVPYSITALENGQYTFWSYEHAFRVKSSSISTETAAEKAADSIADNVYASTVDVASDGSHTTTYNGANTLTGKLGPGVPYTLVNYTRPSTEGQPIDP
jgi:hypothetical protein